MGEGRRAGGQDWLAIWRAMYDAERAQGQAAERGRLARGGDHWAPRAARFAAASRRQPQPDSFMRALAPLLRPGDVVLDVGAGSGRYLPYLAARVARVIAVEPSPGMRAQLEALVAAEGLANVTVLAEPWPMADAPAADVVFSAHVVYGVREVGPFFQAMDGAARRLCALYLGLSHPAAALGPFWARVYGEARLPLPAGLEALCCLHQLGLPARLELLEAPPAFRFPDAAEALEEIRERLGLAPDPASDAQIRAAIADLLEPQPDGGLAPREQQRHAAMLWWGRGDPPEAPDLTQDHALA